SEMPNSNEVLEKIEDSSAQLERRTLAMRCSDRMSGGNCKSCSTKAPFLGSRWATWARMAWWGSSPSRSIMHQSEISVLARVARFLRVLGLSGEAETEAAALARKAMRRLI